MKNSNNCISIIFRKLPIEVIDHIMSYYYKKNVILVFQILLIKYEDSIYKTYEKYFSKFDKSIFSFSN